MGPSPHRLKPGTPLLDDSRRSIDRQGKRRFGADARVQSVSSSERQSVGSLGHVSGWGSGGGSRGAARSAAAERNGQDAEQQKAV